MCLLFVRNHGLNLNLRVKANTLFLVNWSSSCKRCMTLNFHGSMKSTLSFKKWFVNTKTYQIHVKLKCSWAWSKEQISKVLRLLQKYRYKMNLMYYLVSLIMTGLNETIIKILTSKSMNNFIKKTKLHWQLVKN